MPRRSKCIVMRSTFHSDRMTMRQHGHSVRMETTWMEWKLALALAFHPNTWRKPLSWYCGPSFDDAEAYARWCVISWRHKHIASGSLCEAVTWQLILSCAILNSTSSCRSCWIPFDSYFKPFIHHIQSELNIIKESQFLSHRSR